jgi:hypothetical protein
MQSGKSVRTFRSELLPTSSGLNIKPILNQRSQKEELSSNNQNVRSTVDPEDGSNTFLRNAYHLAPHYVASYLKLHGLSPRANYTDRATAACRRSDCQLLRIEGATWSA